MNASHQRSGHGHEGDHDHESNPHRSEREYPNGTGSTMCNHKEWKGENVSRTHAAGDNALAHPRTDSLEVGPAGGRSRVCSVLCHQGGNDDLRRRSYGLSTQLRCTPPKLPEAKTWTSGLSYMHSSPSAQQHICTCKRSTDRQVKNLPRRKGRRPPLSLQGEAQLPSQPPRRGAPAATPTPLHGPTVLARKKAAASGRRPEYMDE